MSENSIEHYDPQVETSVQGKVYLLNPNKREILDHSPFTEWLMETGLLEKHYEIKSLAALLSENYMKYINSNLSERREFYKPGFKTSELRQLLETTISIILNGKIDISSSTYSVDEQTFYADATIFIDGLNLEKEDEDQTELRVKYLGDDSNLFYVIKLLIRQLVYLRDNTWDDDTDSDVLSTVES
jgi:hypothetical protein